MKELLKKYKALDAKVLIKIMEICKEIWKRPVWIGEDGGAVCLAKDERSAWRKFTKLMKEDVGEIEAQEIKEFHKITEGWLHLTSDEEKEKMEDADWYVSVRKPSLIRVWFLRS